MASPFSFHCIICVEEFHADERYPVVLPCGHTYVCNECANRLDKCMECRTSLSLMISTPSTATTSSVSSSSSVSSQMARHPNSPTTGWSSARTRGRIQPNNIYSSNLNTNSRNLPQRDIPPPPVTRRLPLPKNIVLLSLMETTAMTTQNLQNSPMANPIRQSITLEDSEEQSIRDGTSLATGMCGTYIINKPSVSIFPSRPNNADTYTKSQTDLPEEEDVDSLVRFFHMDHQNMKCDTRLNLGDRVQVVSLEDGWAKLARGYGFLRADAGQLVKVGVSVDRACRLEAVLRSLAERRRRLKKDQLDLDHQVITLMRDLHSSLMQDEDLTVIGAETFHHHHELKNVDKNKDMPVNAEERDNESSRRSIPDDNSVNLHSKNEPSLSPAPPKPDCFPNYVEGHNKNRTDQQSAIMGAMSFGSLSFASNASMADTHQSNRRDLTAFGIDFRTGLSGHMALSSTQVRPVDRSQRPSRTMNMSHHSGLSASRPSRQGFQNSVSHSVASLPYSASSLHVSPFRPAPNTNTPTKDSYLPFRTNSTTTPPRNDPYLEPSSTDSVFDV